MSGSHFLPERLHQFVQYRFRYRFYFIFLIDFVFRLRLRPLCWDRLQPSPATLSGGRRWVSEWVLCLILSVFCGCALPPYLVPYLTLRLLTWLWLTLPPLVCVTADFFLFWCKLMFSVCLPVVVVSFFKDVLQNVWCQLLSVFIIWTQHYQISTV